MLEVGVLGPVEALRDGDPLPVGGPRQRAALAVLAVAGRVSVEQLIDGIWGARAPAGAVKTARAYASRLGALLGDGVVCFDRGGYVLDPTKVSVDAVRFRELLRAAREAAAADLHTVVDRLCREALDLWRGDVPADGVALGLDEIVARLTAERLEATVMRLDASLAMGEFATVIATAEEFIRREPLHEGLWQRLMLALYFAGRTADALAAYQRARSILVDEVGLEPGPGLTVLQHQILQGTVPARARFAEGFLPVDVTRFIGRQLELDEVCELITLNRLVTLVGVGGTGKTRLSIALAERWRAQHDAPAWFVDLAPLATPGLVAGGLLSAVGGSQVPGVSALAVAAGRLRRGPALVVLDNCEHLLDETAAVAHELVTACPELVVVATSRSPLSVPGETVYEVPAMALPDERSPRWRAELAAGYDAVRLFTDRARHATGAAMTDADSVATIIGLCRRLDGLPLAIEFAAARLHTLSLHEVAAGIDDRFALLSVPRRGGPDRHRTLRSTMDWSYDLLDPRAQQLLCRVSVFDGGFDLPGARAIAVYNTDVPGLLETLVQASLVIATQTAETTRYRLLETVREYAAELLERAGEHEVVAELHARHYGEFAAAAAPRLLGPAEQETLRVLDAERDNVRAAMRWAADHPAAAGMLASTAIAMTWYWWLRGVITESVEWLSRALELQDPTGIPSARVKVCLARMLSRQGKLDEAESLLLQALPTLRATDRNAETAFALFCLGSIDRWRSRYASAAERFTESHALWLEVGNQVMAAWPLTTLADLAVADGRYEDAERIYEQTVPVLRAHGRPSWIVAVLHSVAQLAYCQGRFDRAEQLSREAMQIVMRTGDVWHEALLHQLLALVNRARHEPALAAMHAVAGLRRFHRLNEPNGVADALETLAGLALDNRRPHAAALLLCGTEQLRTTARVPIQLAHLRRITARDRAAAFTRSGDDLAAIQRNAQAMTIDQLVDIAIQLEAADSPGGPARAQPAPTVGHD